MPDERTAAAHNLARARNAFPTFPGGQANDCAIA